MEPFSKLKIVTGVTKAKNDVFLGLYLENVYLVGGGLTFGVERIKI